MKKRLVMPDVTIQNKPDADLPAGWAESTMGDISTVVGGGTPAANDPSNFADGGYPWITPADLSGFGGIYITRGRRDLSKKGLAGCSTRLMPSGTVLMSSRAPIGYVAIAANELCTNQGFKSFILAPGVEPQYVYYWLKFKRDDIEEMGSGSTFVEISGSRCKEIPISLPPLAEQKRIVAKVEELLARVNAAREHMAKVPAILKRFRQSVLAAACSGRLTEEWRAMNLPAQRTSLSAANAEELSEMPEGWRSAPLGQLAVRITSGSRDWSKYYGRGSGTFIMAQNIRPMALDLSSRQSVNPPEHDRDRQRSQVEKDDLLITIVGANTGDLCLVDSDLPEHYVCQSVALVRLADTREGPFLNLFFNSPQHGGKQLEQLIYGEGRPHLSFDQLRGIAVTLAPLSEQVEIVRRVNELFKLADSIEKQAAAGTARVEKLTQAILAKAFRGELVPQDPDDEPASILLRRAKGAR